MKIRRDVGVGSFFSHQTYKSMIKTFPKVRFRITVKGKRFLKANAVPGVFPWSRLAPVSTYRRTSSSSTTCTIPACSSSVLSGTNEDIVVWNEMPDISKTPFDVPSNAEQELGEKDSGTGDSKYKQKKRRTYMKRCEST